MEGLLIKVLLIKKRVVSSLKNYKIRTKRSQDLCIDGDISHDESSFEFLKTVASFL